MIYATILREWKRLLRTRLTIWGLFILPLLTIIIFFTIYYNAYVLKIPTVVVDKDRTHTSRRLIRYFEQSRYISIDQKTSDFKSAIPMIYSQKAYILIYIPEHFEKNLLQYNQPTVKTYSFGTNLLIGRLAQKASVDCIGALSKERVQSNVENLRQESVYTKNTGTQPELLIHNVFNPAYNYLWYMSPAVVMSLWQMILLIVMIPLFSKEWEKDKYRELKEVSGKSAINIYLGKLTLPWFFMMLNYFILYYVFFPLFKLQILGDFILGFILLSLFFISIINLAVIITNVVKQSLFSTEIGVFLTAPAFAFSGYTYPFQEMPLFHQLFAYLMPSTHLLPVYSMYYLQDSPLYIQVDRMTPLIIYFVITSILAILLIHKNLNNQVRI